MAKLLIQGGRPLKGVVRLGGAKNASFKIMIASLLCPDEVKLLNFSQIADVDLVRKIIASLGVKIYSAGERTMFINSAKLSSFTIPPELGLASRASSLFLAPLLARCQKAVVPFPGGDRIGLRPLDRHFAGLSALGAKIKVKANLIEAVCPQLVGAKYRFAKSTHTGTETLIMAGVLAKGKTVLENCALEPEVDDLIVFLNKLGGRIKRKPNRVIEIIGVRQLKPAIHQIMPDRNEAVSYAIASLVTRGEVVVENARPADLTAFLAKVKSAGAGYEIANYGIRFYFKQTLKAVDITTQPHPGFMTDWLPLWAVLASQSQGKSKLIETVFTSRFQYVQSLQQMGAKIEFFQPVVSRPNQFYNFNLKDDQKGNDHGIEVVGPSRLQGQSLAITDIRAGATLVLAGLASQGKTVLTEAEHLDRGYEDFSGRLQALGAKIKRIN